MKLHRGISFFTCNLLLVVGLVLSPHCVAAKDRELHCKLPVLNADALWKKVKERCLGTSPNATSCLLTSPDYILFRTDVGSLHYLLIPSITIPGVESSELWRAGGAPAYFSAAWQERDTVAKALALAPKQTLGIAINSACKRSQNQLHVHISCTREDVLAELKQKMPSIAQDWVPITLNSLQGQQYFAKTMAGADIPDTLFPQIAERNPGIMARPETATVFATTLKDNEARERAVVLVGYYREDDTKRYPGHAEDLLSQCRFRH